MFDERSSELIGQGFAAANAGQREEARRLFELALASDPTVANMIRAWQGMSEITSSADERRDLLEKMLSADPYDAYARRELSILNGALGREEVVDPDGVPLPGDTAPRLDPSHGFLCPRCGSGRMVADPAHHQLECRHCGYRESIGVSASQGPERDMTAALWTARGRSTPRSVTVFDCKRCGASFLAPPEGLSANCPYCGTVYVADAAHRRDLIEPDGIVPFAVAVQDAQRSLAEAGVNWISGGLRGVYIPGWLFTFAGEAAWRAPVSQDQYGLVDSAADVLHTYTLGEVKVCVPASSQAPDTFHASMHDEFDWQALVRYQAALLADWPAETYRISLETAAATARSVAIRMMRDEVREEIGLGVSDFRASFVGVSADSFQLVLVPLWLAQIDEEGTRTTVFVNGQSGKPYLPQPSGFWNRLSRLF